MRVFRSSDGYCLYPTLEGWADHTDWTLVDMTYPGSEWPLEEDGTPLEGLLLEADAQKISFFTGPGKPPDEVWTNNPAGRDLLRLRYNLSPTLHQLLEDA